MPKRRGPQDGGHWVWRAGDWTDGEAVDERGTPLVCGLSFQIKAFDCGVTISQPWPDEVHRRASPAHGGDVTQRRDS